MRKLFTFLSLLFILTCAKEDSQTSNTAPTQTVKQYALTASAGDGGSVTGGGTFASGTQVSLTATPSSGYSFSGWSNGSTANPLTLTLNSNTSITANFQVIVNSYTLSVTSEEGGSVSTEGGEYEEGTEVTITATPDEGYRFTGWSDDSTEESITITLNSDTSLTANFELIPVYTLTVTAGDGGSISGSGEYEEGTEVTITATANEGFEFEGWEGDDSDENSITISVNSNISLSAVFSRMNPIYLDSNGITIKAYDWSITNEIGIINGVEYLIVDDNKLREMISNNLDVSKIVTTKVNNMSALFAGNELFNDEIGSWDVSNVTQMGAMFQGTIAFNKDISHWDTSNVIDMRRIFYGSTFNVDISEWNVSSVTNMKEMFARNRYFNHNIDNWDVSSVTNMERLFYDNSKFDMPLNNWDVSSVINMYQMFRNSVF